MKVNVLGICGVLALVAGCLVPNAGRYEGAASRVAPKHVILVGWDGFAGNTVADAKIPTVRKLMSEGAWTVHSRSILPSASACNWHSLFTCSASEQHGYNEWNSSKPIFAASMLAENGMYPDFIYMLRKQNPSAEIGYVYDWSGMAFTADTNSCSYAERMPMTKITSAAVKYIKEKKPNFFSIYYDSPDDIGHKNGWGTPEYHARVAELDAELAQILAALKEADMLDDTVVVFTSDHGGLNKGHGGPTLSEMERPVVIWGKGVKKGYELKFPGTIYDTGATIAALLGIDPPISWIGRPFDEAFER